MAARPFQAQIRATGVGMVIALVGPRELNVSHINIDHLGGAGNMDHHWAHAGEPGQHVDVDIVELATGTALSVYTRNTHYRITVINGATGAIVIQGGSHFPTPAYVRLLGGGGADEAGRIEVGERLRLTDGSRQVVTSPVRTIVLDEVGATQRDFWRIA
jgi:hypothetical protein